MPAPLAGITVLDLGQVYNGPYSTLLLGYLGADVIKIEPPGGEHLRFRSREGTNYALVMMNTNKKGITLNIKDERGKALLLKLVAQADVLVENFSAGVMDRLGLGWNDLKRVNPRLIFASGKGYGTEGPYRDYPAMDLTIQAISGIMSGTGFRDGPPVKCGAAISDFMGGIHLLAGIMTALYRRERTGEGDYVEVSMHDAAYPTLTSHLTGFFTHGESFPERSGNQHDATEVAPYNVYECRDGYLAIICVRNKQWRTLCELMNRPELGDDPRYKSNVDRAEHVAEIDAVIQAWTSTRDKDQIFQLLVNSHIPAAPVKTVKEVASDPHLIARGMIREIEHPTAGRVKIPGSPIRLASQTELQADPAPELGQHNEQVYGQLCGLSPDQVLHLRQEGVL